MSVVPPLAPVRPVPDWARVHVHPGRGLVDRHGETLLVLGPVPTSRPEPVRELLDLCGRPDPTGSARLPALRALVDRYPAGELPAFAVLTHVGGSLHVALHGPLRVFVDGKPPAPAGGPGGGRLAEHVAEAGAWQEVTVLAEADPVADDVRDGIDVLPFHLESGTVPGGGVTLHAVGSPGPTPSTELRPVVRFRSILLGECADRAPGKPGRRARPRPPLPVAAAPGDGVVGRGTTDPEVLVDGVLCPDGHFTDPELPACRTCGTPLPAGTPHVSRPRPPLGLLVTDGGTIYPVTGDLLIGREAEQAPDVLAGRARPLPLRDAARSTSRVHARIAVSGWKVLLSDNSSANGTFVSHHGAAGPWLPVMPGAPMPLLQGDRVRLGRRQLLFDTWRETVVPQASR